MPQPAPPQAAPLRGPSPIQAARLTWRITDMALGALWAYKLRSLFVVLAVALGIASLAIIVASVDGAQRKAVEIVQVFGPDAVLVFGGNIRSRAVGERTQTLTVEDIERLRQSLPGAYLVVPMTSMSDVTLRFGNRNTRVSTVIGTTDGYAEAWNWPLVEGRDLSQEDVREAAKVAVIGNIPNQDLFGDETPVGKTIFVRDLPVQIVGRLAVRGVSGGQTPPDDRIVLPITTLVQRFNLDRRYYRALRIKFLEPSYMASHVENLRGLLRHLHNLGPDQEDDFTIITSDEVLRFLSMLQGSLVIFLGVTAAAAMLVGGFVLANLFYLSVTERRSEVGLKKALGARNWMIMTQFLAEAVALTTVGAVVGLVVGLGFGQLLAELQVLEIRYTPRVFVLAFLSAVFIGLAFGLRPARQAASLDPIEAMRGTG